jgi:hypothetical protein
MQSISVPQEGVKSVVLDGEILTAADRERCLQRVRGALRLFYEVADKTGSPRLKGAALDALNAARVLA